MTKRIVSGMLLSVLIAATACQNGETHHHVKKGETPSLVLTQQSIQVPQTYVADIHGVQFVEVKPKIEGFIEEICVDEGQMVKKGEPLFRLSADEYQENMREAQAALKQAEAAYQMASYEVSRISRLVEKDIISPIRLEKAKAELEMAQLGVEQAQAQYQRSQLNHSYTVISAPYNGYIDRIPYKVGSLVNTESLLTAISDVTEVFAYYKMNESDYLKFRRAQLSGSNIANTDSITLYLSDGSVYEHKGRVETIEGDFERGTGSIAFRARFPNPEGLLRHGVTGKVSMTTPMDDVYLIPQQSTFEIQEFTYVYVISSEGKAQIRSFEPIGRYGDFYIADDFQDSTRIVYSGIQEVKDGESIRFKDINDRETEGGTE